MQKVIGRNTSMSCSRQCWLSLILTTLLFPLAGSNVAVSYIRGYTLPHKNLCKQMGSDLRLLILVASPVNNAARRDAIRFSWGHYARSSHVVVAFVLGVPEPNMLNVLASEDALYGDLIIGKSDDSYPVFKMATMFDWTYSYCLNAPRVLTTNDRVFTNVMNLLKLAEAPQYVKVRLTVWGDFIISNNDITSADVYLFSNDTVARLMPRAVNITSSNGVLLSAHTSRDISRQRVSNFSNNLQQSCNIKLHVVCRIFLHYQHYELWQSLIESQNVTRNLYFRKGVSVVVGSSSRSVKPVVNNGIYFIFINLYFVNLIFLIYSVL